MARCECGIVMELSENYTSVSADEADYGNREISGREAYCCDCGTKYVEVYDRGSGHLLEYYYYNMDTQKVMNRVRYFPQGELGRII